MESSSYVTASLIFLLGSFFWPEDEWLVTAVTVLVTALVGVNAAVAVIALAAGTRRLQAKMKMMNGDLTFSNSVWGLTS